MSVRTNEDRNYNNILLTSVLKRREEVDRSGEGIVKEWDTTGHTGVSIVRSVGGTLE